MARKLYDFEEFQFCTDKVFLLNRKHPDEETAFTYCEILKVSQSFSNFLLKLGVKGIRVSIQCPHSPELCVILLSVLNCQCSFCPITYDADQSASLDAVWKFDSPYFISYINFDCTDDKLQLVAKETVIDTEFSIYKILINENHVNAGKAINECFSIKTSGSTGDAKIVRVPYQCIEPNITGLSLSLEITSNDVIFLSSPITFDPFVVEFFLAVKNRAALLITSPEIRREPQILADVLQPKKLQGVTILQTTPSLFRFFGLKTIQQHILRRNTSIRILLLGGERFPCAEEIMNWTTENCFNTRIFNIYGITEVSCWSTLHEVGKLQTGSRIPIGLPIDLETHIRVVDDKIERIYEGIGEIQIGSASRKCTVDDETQSDVSNSNVLFRATGDVGLICEGVIFYEGRKTEVVKRYGHRVHVGHITETVLKINGVVNVESCFNDENMRLIIFVLKNIERTKLEIQQEILAKLRNFEKPDDIIFVDFFPLTKHGKISKKKLLNRYTCLKNDTPINVFQKFVTNVLCLNKILNNSVEVEQEIGTMDVSFQGAGGTSLQALSLSAHIENILQRPEPRLLEMMLNGKSTLSDIFIHISNMKPNPFKGINREKLLNNSNGRKLLKIKWEYDTGKCVDATPSCYGNVVCVGSHSKLLVSLDTETGQEVSTCILPDRIECQVSFIDDRLLLVGCYDGFLYAIDYLRGEFEWKFDCGGMIKAKPLQNGNLVLIGTYSKSANLICLKLNEKMPEWKIQIGSKGIFASPIKLNETTFLACCLDGEIACVIFTTGSIVWRSKYESPIFSTPAILGTNAVVVAEVSGFVHCFNFDSGSEIWSFRTDGNIFSSLKVCDKSDKKFIIFGNHDHNIYCLKSSQVDQNPSIEWKCEVDSAVYSTPHIFSMHTDILAIISCSTKGNIYILDFLSGLILFTMDLGNEIFSSPCLIKNKVFVGCRNNNVVCLELHLEQ